MVVGLSKAKLTETAISHMNYWYYFLRCFFPINESKHILSSPHSAIRKYIPEQTCPISHCALTFSWPHHYTHRRSQHIIITPPPPWTKFISEGRGAIKTLQCSRYFLGPRRLGKGQSSGRTMPSPHFASISLLLPVLCATHPCPLRQKKVQSPC